MTKITTKKNVSVSIEVDTIGYFSVYFYNEKDECISHMYITEKQATRLSESLGLEISLYMF